MNKIESLCYHKIKVLLGHDITSCHIIRTVGKSSGNMREILENVEFIKTRDVNSLVTSYCNLSIYEIGSKTVS